MGDIVGRKGDGAAGHAFADKLRKAIEPYVRGKYLNVQYSPRFGASILIAFSSVPKGSPELQVLNSTHRLHLWIRNPRGDSREEWNDAVPGTLGLDVQKLSYKGKLKPRQIKAGTPDKIFNAVVGWFKKNGKAMVEEGVSHHESIGFVLEEGKEPLDDRRMAEIADNIYHHTKFRDLDPRGRDMTMPSHRNAALPYQVKMEREVREAARAVEDDTRMLSVAQLHQFAKAFGVKKIPRARHQIITAIAWAIDPWVKGGKRLH